MKHVLVVVVACLSLCQALLAQGGALAQIDGVVRDSTGSLVPGAAVMAIQTETGFSRTVETGGNGEYRLPSLPIGPYRLEVSKDGFSRYVQSGIVLQVSSNPSIDVSLAVGAVAEQVNVEAAAAMVETTSTGVGQVVDQRRVVDLPLNGRIATELITLTGAAVQVPTANVGQLISGKNYPNAVAISVAGGPANGLTYTLDGASHNDPVNNAGLPLPFPDALQEFKVETSALPAQYGQHAGGAINVVTKAGGNAFHGSAFEFLRNRALTTRNFFATERDTLRRHQFGGTLGGPIIKNKLFFFTGYQQTIQKSDASKGVSFIPTADMLRGDFTTIASPACNGGRQINLGAPFTSNTISPSLFSPAAVKMTSYFGSTTDPCGRVGFTSNNSFDEQAGIAKVDWQMSTNHTAFIRYLAAHSSAPSSFTGSPLSILDAAANNLVNSITLGETWVVNASTVNTFRANFNRAAINKTQITVMTGRDLGINMTPPAVPNNVFVTVSGALYSAGIQSFSASVPTQSHQITDDVSLIRGSHQIQFGGNWIRPVQNALYVGTNGGNFSFSGQFSGLPMADFLTGRPSSFGQSNGSVDAQRIQYVGLYVQDSWRVNSRLRVNVGMRWEPYLSAQFKNGRVTHFDRANFDANIHSAIYPNAPAGILYPGDEGFKTNNRAHNVRLNNFSPRVGLVWDPRGDGRMTLRASWGMLPEVPHLLFYNGFGGVQPWGGGITIPSPVGGFDDPWRGYPGGNPYPLNLTSNYVFPTGGGYLTVPLNLRPTYLQQWNVSLQRQLGADWLASATYMGNNTTHMWAARALNPSVYIPGTCGASPCSSLANTAARRALTLANPTQGAYINSLTELDDGATASYNAMLLSLQHRFAKNFTVLGNYTWSHCIADPITTLLGGSYVNPGDRRYDRGNCGGIDIRHLVNVSAAVESPRFDGRLTRALMTGWQISPILSYRSGSYMNVTTGVDNALNNVGSQRPNQVLENVYCANRGPNCWLNPAAFAAPAAGTFGSSGAYSVLGPNFFNVNVSATRRFAIREGHSLEVRADGFNVQNRVNFSFPIGALNSVNFGKVTSDVNSAGSSNGSPRIIQLSAKYTF